MESVMKFRTICVCFGLLTSVVAVSHGADETSRQVVSHSSRSPEYVLRDQYRHSYQTLNFFRVSGHQTVVEIWPGGGWYTEILAPIFAQNGTYYAAHFSESSGKKYFDNSLAKFKTKLIESPHLYGNVSLVQFSPKDGVLDVPVASADRVLTFRNVHNWLKTDSEQAAFDLFYKTLKPGGLLGVVEHRAREDITREEMIKSGYMTESAVIALAARAGFVFEGSSEVNANPKDSTDHPAGVWTLAPSLRLKEVDRDKYLAIGESDRMTLLFRKPK
jgi:predicted methyltransferase